MAAAPPARPARFRPAPVRVGAVPLRRPLPFDLAPDAEARAALAAELGLIALPAFRFHGTLTRAPSGDVTLQGRLAAEAVQACVVTLEPVPARVDEPVHRLYAAADTMPAAAETEMPQDTDREPLPEAIDLAAVAAEALVLALPDYPRAPGAALDLPSGDGGPDARATPLAGLAALRGRPGDGG
jgi:uncharacterized metal-binding protein YceD (DUF177 family)